MDLFKLAWEFFKIGLLSYGGGFGIIPLIYAIWASLNKKNILVILGVTGLWGIIMM